ncbi:MAG TPA: NosD domain-containing protein, partial [Patescibacteria group bacterium]|nr:NosD domain-containing protein [Patescibacteria group bacterium]
MKVTCTSCTKRFDGRRDAKTCSPRCRKRLQRLILAASQVTHEVGDEIKDEIKQVEQAVETSARALVSNQEGFALVDEPGAVATAPPTTTISPQTVTPMPAPQVSIPNPAPTPIAVAREPQPAPVNVQPTPAPIPVVPEPKTVSTVPIRPAPTPISSPVSTIPGPTFPIQPKPQPSLPINDIYAKPTPSSFEPAKPSTNSSSLSNLGYYETPVKSVTNGPVVSSYSAPQANYLVNSSLEVHDPGNIPLPTKEKPKQNNYYSTGVSPFSRRRTKVLASLVVAGIVIFSSVGFLVAGRQTPLFQKAKQGVSPQDISLRDNVLTTAPQALQGTNKAIFVNGDIITNSTLKVVNGNTTTTIGLDNPTSDHEVKFPDASGTVCLTTNNCSFATTGELTALQRQVANNSANNTTSTSSNNNGVSSVNNATGDITIQGTPNQVNVTTSGTTITLSTPQDINTNSDVQFGSLNLSGDLTLGPGSTLFTNGIIQTGTGNDISINAGSDNIVFTAGGRTFQFPTSGPGSQTICTTGVTCASGGGQAVLLAPGSVQNDNTVDASIFINDTGGGNLLQFQSGGVDRFVVSNSGGITAASLTLGSPLTIPNGGTGATTASGARTNLGAAASGANADITSTTALNTITPSAALTVGATGQSFVLQGNASSTITATGGGFTTTIGFAGTPVGNITYNFDRTASAGTYTICTTAGNCVGTGGGVSTPGGTTNRVAKFTAAQSIGDSNISDDGTTVTILSALGINGNVTVGDASTDRVTFTSQILGANPLVFQGATDNASTTTFAITDPTALRTITFPNASGTVAVSASGNIALDSFGNITFTGTLPVGNGGTGATSFTSNGVIYGNGAGALQVTSAGTPGQVLLANASGVPTFTTLSGDVTVNSTGATTIQPDSVALGTDTTGNYVTSLTAGNGISVGAAGESATPTVALAALTADWNQTGAFDITLNNASSELKILESAGATFFGTLDVGDLTANRTYVLPDLTAASDTICLVTLGNCAGSGGGVTTSGGTTNRVAKFTGANSIGDSTISDDGTNVSLTGNLSIQGGTVNLGVASTTTGSLNLYNGASANAGTLQVSSLGQATTFNLPDPGAASVDICLSSGNCVGGGGGGAPNGAAYLTVGNDATLSAERAIAVNATNLSFTDGGANGSYTINTIQGIATTSTPSFAGLTLTGNLNLGANTLQGTTAIIDFTNFDVASNGNVTAGTFNSQTISSAANFTGTLAVTTLGSASTDTVICRNGSNQLATCNSTFATTANAFLQGGNSFGTTAILGTNDANSLNIRTNSTTAISIDTSQNTTFSGNIVVAANKSLTLNGGNTASRPASPTEGMVYYDTTTKQLLTYANGKWQADRTTATKIVAASNSSQAEKDAADYVADGTGDQVEINAALTAASGGKVYLMEGTYVANATILIPNNTTLAGAGRGTDIELADIDATDNLIENSDTSTGTGITIRDLRIDGRNDLNTAGVQHGVYLNGMGGGSGASVRVGAKLSNLYVANFRGNGFGNCIYLINSRGNTLINNRAENCRFGFFLETSPNNTLSNNFAENNGSEGFYVYNSSDNTVLDGNTASNSHEGFDLESSSGITLTNNIAEDSAGGGDGIFIYQVSNSVVSGNISRNNAGEGIYLLDSSNITVTGNSITQSGYDGIGIETSDSNVVSGNKISDSGQTDGTGDGIYLTTADNNSITGNTITDTAGIDYAINIFNSTSDKTYLSNNTFSGTGASSINDLGTGTVYANQARGQNGAQLTVRTANATDAFQIQNATGSALFTADTTNQRIGIGDTTPAYALTVGNGDL